MTPNSDFNPPHPPNAWYLAVALPVPLRRLFDYLSPIPIKPGEESDLIGRRTEVSFRSQTLVGVIVSCHQTPTIDPSRIKPANAILDAQPIIPAELLKLCGWASNYYQHPFGETLHAALPQRLRQGKAEQAEATVWALTIEAKGLPHDALKRAKKQQQIFQHLLQHNQLTQDKASGLGFSNSVLASMQKKGLLEKKCATDVPPKITSSTDTLLKEAPLSLTDEQQAAIDHLRYHQFNTYLLEGATGSGKTEIYLQVVARVLQAQQQALILIPEIGLSPQTVMRFRRRFNCEIAELHSNISEVKRTQSWLAARDGRARIVIGTRLASLTPIKNLGVIIIDEEHDLSYKQQDNLRYSARDLSIFRASNVKIPIILGSATPSLETLHNALQGRYQHLRLTKRAGKAQPPRIRIVDLRQQTLSAGLSNQAVEALGATLNNGHQAIVFINRRGYAPTLLCHQCGWVAECRNCDAHMTLHRSPLHLHCHHCDSQQPVRRRCPSCNSDDINPKGLGTEQTELWLNERFPSTPILRVDKDSTQRKNALSNTLKQVAEGAPCILIGTQMLAKGHHLPNIALVIIVDCDQGLLSSDFRGPERMGQLIVQVAGRAGRESIPGQVLIQSHTPDHPLLQFLLTKGYHQYAREILKERQVTGLPPFGFTALFRAESKRANNAIEFLQMVANTFNQLAPASKHLRYLGPVPARMEKLNERYRYQFQLTASSRKGLQEILKKGLEHIDQHALAKRTRWSIDVDALES
ncbi:primosomal protein N' [Teredinibacter purpureus]|uniref:primosomal protein N' n=1 Tax=Teredinibacter purpureus TaxID=2731756 RepID=UPI0005F82EB7|nr:primosomal protein N' [Teredinibacter purpureus]